MPSDHPPTAWPRYGLPAAIALNLVALFSPGPGGAGLFPGSDKVAHLVLFAVVAWPAVRVGLRRPLVAGVLTVHAVGSEVIQHHLVPGRTGDPSDVLADLAGVALGVLLARRPRRTVRPR